MLLSFGKSHLFNALFLRRQPESFTDMFALVPGFVVDLAGYFQNYFQRRAHFGALRFQGVALIAQLPNFMRHITNNRIAFSDYISTEAHSTLSFCAATAFKIPGLNPGASLAITFSNQTMPACAAE